MARPAEADAVPPAPSAIWPGILKAGTLLVLLVAGALLLRRSGTAWLHAVPPSAAGALVMIVAGGAVTACGVPRQILAFAAGFVFSAPAGAAISLAGQLLGCLADYLAARGLASGLAAGMLARPTARRTHRFLAAHPFSATLTLRLLPISSNLLLNLLAGASRLNARAFFSATALGYVPQTIVFALLGSGTQVGRGVQLALGVLLFGAATVLGVWLVHRDQAARAM